MKNHKFSKTDFSSFQAKHPKPAIDRSHFLAHAWPARKQLIPPLAEPTPIRWNLVAKSWPRLTIVAVAALIVVILLQGLSYLSGANNATGQILGAATSAYTDLHTARENLELQQFGAAQQLFDAASDNIGQAQTRLNQFQVLKLVVPKAQSADHLLKGASQLAEAGKYLSQALSLFQEVKVSSKGFETQDLPAKISENRKLLVASREQIQSAAEEFKQVGDLPLDYGSTLDTAKQQVAELSLVLGKLIGLEDLYLGFFGGQKTYLLVFQNYDEARATGGFIGTYGVLTMDRGAIKRLKIQSIYDLDGQIHDLVAAPGPFQPTIKKWGIRDANWFADFPTSAKKLLDFFEKGSSTADGIISATPKMFEDLLTLTGPIAMPQYGVTLTAQNFQDVVQYKTSIDYDKQANEPKKMLDDLAPILLNRLSELQPEQWLTLLQLLEDNFSQRQIMLYSKEPQAEQLVDELGFSGKVRSTDLDYLSIINTNLGGTKTDLEIVQSASLSSKILSDGSIVNTLSITRKNQATEHNKDYIRILVPVGSDLVSATGFDPNDYHSSEAPGFSTDPDLHAWDQGRLNGDVYVRTESAKTEFAGWVDTQAGQSRTLTLTYILPMKLTGQTQSYSLLVQKQAGSLPYEFRGLVNLGSFRSEWISDGVKPVSNNLNFSSNRNMDDFWAAVVTK